MIRVCSREECILRLHLLADHPKQLVTGTRILLNVIYESTDTWAYMTNVHFLHVPPVRIRDGIGLRLHTRSSLH